MDLNVLERVLARIDPAWGVSRLQHKLALAQARSMARGYDAARQDRRTGGWRASNGSAAVEVGQALSLVRARSRDLVRNNEWAGAAKRKLVAHMVGTGFQPRAADWVAKGQKAKAADLWAAFGESCDPEGLTDIYGKMAQAAAEVVEGGACLIRWHTRPPTWGLKVPLQCEVIEHDHLDTARTEILKSGNVVVQGVEFDGHGRRVAYWLFREHPGDTSTRVWRRGRGLSERVPAEDVDHVFRVDRAGQVTGIPWFAPIALRLRDTADYEEAELIRKKIEACLTVFVRRTGQGPTTLAQANRQEVNSEGSRLEKIAPGLIAYLKEGEDITAAIPSPSSGLADHVKHQLLAAAAGIGLPYSMFSGDLSQANYSSLREGKLDFWAVLDQWQWHMLIPQMANKMWRRAMVAAAGRGHAVAADTPAEWTVPKRPWVDPKKDLEAEGLEMRYGLETWSGKVAARGYDPEEQKQTLAAERKELAEIGIGFDDKAPGPSAAEPAAAPADEGNRGLSRDEIAALIRDGLAQFVGAVP